MNKSIKTLAFALLTMSLLGACTQKSNNSSSANSSGSSSSVSSESGSSSSSSSSSEVIPETIDGTLELLAQKIATKKAMVTVPDYRRAEYLGPNIAVSTYLGDHASSGTYYYFVNEQGYFCYQDTGEGPVLKSKDLDPSVDLYADKIYSMYDAFDEHFGEYVLLDSATEDAWIVDFDVENGAAYKGGFATVVGYGYSDGDYITEIKATIAKNASSIDLTVTFSDSSQTIVETASITEIGTHENADALAVINAIPPYVPEPVVWPAEDVAAIIEALVPGSPTVLPECPGGESVKVYSSLKEVDVKGPESLKDAYKAILTTALWTEEPADSYVFVSPARDIQASLSWNSTYGLEIHLAVYVVPNYDWPAEDIAAAFVTAGTTAFAFPSLTGEGFVYEFDDSYVESSYKVAIVRIGGTASAAALPGYKTALETAGWTVEYNESYDEYYASKTFEDGIANLTFYFYNSQISIIIYLAKDPLPTATWPAEEIAAYLGVGVTDEVPAYEGEATSFQFFAEYGVVLVGVAEGTEASAVSAYQTALANANYVTDVEDSYGVHYISENNQIDVVAYAYATGQIAIAIAPSPIYAAFPVDKVNAFLTEYELAFSLTASMFEGLSVTEYRLASGEDYYGYHFVSVTVAGDLADEFTTILSPVLTAAGYQYDDEYECWYNSDVHQVMIEYDSTAGVTEVYFWE